MLRIAIVMGSTHTGRLNDAVARWVYDVARTRNDADFELVDIAEYHLPLLDEAIPPTFGQYGHEHKRKWAQKIASFDAYVFVTPEYNHGVSAALKNAIDYLFREWNNKAAGLVSYGSVGGARAAEQLRLVLADVMVAAVRAQVTLSLFTDFEKFTRLKPDSSRTHELHAMLDQLVAWSKALKSVRWEASAKAASASMYSNAREVKTKVTS
jgi:NAD(P)H-dependent FMN reductase